MNFQIGDKVLVKTFYLSNAKKNLIFIAKLLPRFEGPFEVIDSGHYKVNLKLKDCRTGKTRMWGGGGGGKEDCGDYYYYYYYYYYYRYFAYCYHYFYWILTANQEV